MVTTPFRVVELFAGDGKLGKTAHYAHMSTAQLDICMGRNSWRRTRKAFDLLTPEGIASTDCMWRRAFFFSAAVFACLGPFHLFPNLFCSRLKLRSKAGSVDIDEC